MNAVLQTLPLEQLIPSTTHAQTMRRKSFNKDALGELAASIKQHGVLQPIVVRLRAAEKTGGVTIGEHFEIVAGERRWRAAQLAGLQAVPVNLLEISDEQVIEIQLIENLQREDVHPMLEAEGYHELVHTYGHAIEDVYSKVGKSRSYVYGRMKLLALSTKAREAFYSNEISASIANLIARIPVEKLQDEALEAVLGFPHARESWHKRPPMSFRQAAEHINEHFMLDLSAAPFPIDDEKLNGAGPCSKCPKRTGNQPELFADVKKGNVCTDTVCFEAKGRAWGQRQVKAARAEGRPVITGPQAKKIAPNGIEREDPYVTNGYAALDGEIWTDNGRKPTKKLLKDGAEIATLVDDKTGRAIEVVKVTDLRLPKERRSTADNGETARRQKAARENRFRRAVYDAMRPKLKRPTDHQLARAAYNALDAELQKLLWTVRGVEILKSKHGIFDRDKHEAMIEKLQGDELVSFMNDCIYMPTLRTSTWSSDPTPARLLDGAKLAGVDVAKIRRELAPKKKPAAKAKAKPKKSSKKK